MIGLSVRGLAFSCLAMAACALGGMGPLHWGDAPAFRGPVAALGALAGAGLLSFGLPWGGARQPTERVRARVLAAAGLSMGIWLPFAGLWGRSNGSADAPLVLSVAAAIAAMAVLAELNRRGGLGRAPGALLVLVWIGLASLVLPGGSRLPSGAGGPLEQGARGAWELIEADVELAGPLLSATLSYEGYPPLNIEASLLPGESAKARAWIVAPRDRSFVAHERPDLVDSMPAAPGGVTVRPLPRWDRGPDFDGEADPLFRRALPAARAPGGRVPASAWFAAVGVGILLSLAVLRFGARLAFAPAALAVGIGAWQFCLGGQGAAEGGSAGSIIILEGSASGSPAGSGARWALIQRFGARYVSVDPLDAGPGSPNSGASPQMTLRLGDPRGPARTSLRVSMDAASVRSVEGRADDEAIDRIQPSLDLGMRLLMREVNTLGAFEAAWCRAEDGSWSGGAPWPLGTAYPEGPSTENEPPPWSGAGLPMGMGVFVGRLDPAAARALGEAVGDPWGLKARGSLPGEPTESAAVWVRLLGF